MDECIFNCFFEAMNYADSLKYEVTKASKLYWDCYNLLPSIKNEIKEPDYFENMAIKHYTAYKMYKNKINEEN